MADADESRLNLGMLMAPRGHGRPRGSKNKTAADAVGSLIRLKRIYNF
jgi:hypothetical protein